MEVSSWEIVSETVANIGTLSGLCVIGSCAKCLISEKDSFKLASAGLGVTILCGVTSTLIDSKVEKEEGKVPGTLVEQKREVIENRRKNSSYASSYQYFMFDTDNNPQTIEFAGKGKITPTNMAKWRNADVKVGKIMPINQWRDLNIQISRVD